MMHLDILDYTTVNVENSDETLYRSCIALIRVHSLQPEMHRAQMQYSAEKCYNYK